MDQGQGPASATAAARSASAWAPLRYYRIYRTLWIAQFASNIGTWMQTVGAQWLLVHRSALLVSLVQTASSLPIVLLALPAGAWADSVDRRRLPRWGLGSRCGCRHARREPARSWSPWRAGCPASGL